MKKIIIHNLLLYLSLITIIICIGCNELKEYNYKQDKPEEITFPDNPIEKAAVQGLITSYKESTMWQIQKVKPISMTPMAPTGVLVELQDPKELYCVCLEYEARYKVEWTTSDGSPWEKTVRNILVMKTQGDQYLAVRPMNICAPFCS